MNASDYDAWYAAKAAEAKAAEANAAEAAAAAPAEPEPEATAEPVPAPPRGEVCRYTTWDAYADPARDRDQLVLVTGGPDDTGAVLGFVLGWADAIEASFRPEDLRPA